MPVALGMVALLFFFLTVCCTQSSLKPDVNDGLFVVGGGLFLTLQCDLCGFEYL